MTSIKSLREEQARIATNARAKFNEITDDTPEDRAAEIEREFDAMMADHDKIEAKIERLSKLESVERSLDEAPDPRRPRGNGEARGADHGQGPTYREAFHAYLRAQGNLGAMGSEERAALTRGYAEVEVRAQTTTDAAGGYMVPTELANILIKSMAAWGPMYDPGITSEIVTSGGYPITMPTVNDTGTAVVKHTEGTTLTDDGGSDVTFGEKVLNAYAFNTEWLRVSKELMDDASFNVEQILGELLGERLARRANLELTVGDGNGDPNGIVTASSLGDTAASATAVTGDELIDHLHTVDPAYRASPRARWMFNDTTLAFIRKLKDGDGNYLWQMGDVRAGEPATLLGFPYTVNQAMPAMTTGLKPIIFGDFGKYYVRKVGSPLIGAIQDKDFWPGFGIAGYIRLDGELADTAAVKHLLMA
jgi:HK97 family phage major capsid protein